MNWLGNIAGDVLAWVISGSAASIAAFLVNWLAKKAALLKVNIKDADRARLQEMVENGIKWAARKLGIKLDGAVTEANKTALIDEVAKEYLPMNAKETIAALGGNVNDAYEMMAMVTARAADVLALPAIDRAMATVATEVVAAPVKLPTNLLDRRRLQRKRVK